MIPLRDENETETFPVFVLFLILANAAVFFYEVSLGEPVEQWLITRFAIFPARFFEFGGEGFPTCFPTLFSSMFLHGGLLHLLGNMWYLWIFGDNIEDQLGHWGFLSLYLATGAAAGITHVLSNSTSQIPTLGASGAISGVLGAYMVLYPRIRVKTLLPLGFYVTIVNIPAGFFLILWFLLQLLGGFGDLGGVAYGAHIGGFVAGVVLILIVTRSTRDISAERSQARRTARWRI